MSRIEESAKKFAQDWRIEAFQLPGYRLETLPRMVIDDIKDRLYRAYIAGARAVLEEARRMAINGSVPPTRSVVRVVPLSDLESLFTDTEEK